MALQVKVLNRRLIKASDHSLQSYVLPFSNYDLIAGNHPNAAVYIYPRPADGRHVSAVVSTFLTFLPAFLGHFFPFAGRITTDSATGLPQVLCDNAGAQLVEAEADAPLSSINFHRLNDSLGSIVLPYAADVALCVQVVGYSCGGFSVAWSANHMLTDGAGLSLLSCAWAEYVRTGNITRGPKHDRSMFKPRYPPRFAPALAKDYVAVTSDDFINVLSAEEMLSAGVYYVDSSDLERLRATASSVGRRATLIEAFSAHVWKVLADVVGKADSTCRMGWYLDGRRAMGADGGYMGNILSTAVGEARVDDIISSALPDTAAKVASSIGAVANRDHFLDLMDWIELNKTVSLKHRIVIGLGAPTIVLSSCHHLLWESEFGFGRAAMVAPHSTGSERLGTGFITIVPSTKRDGSWVVSAFLWPKVARALELDPICRLRPLTAEYLGIGRLGGNVDPISRL